MNHNRAEMLCPERVVASNPIEEIGTKESFAPIVLDRSIRLFAISQWLTSEIPSHLLIIGDGFLLGVRERAAIFGGRVETKAQWIRSRVSEIANTVGFQSLTHFNRVFRKITGGRRRTFWTTARARPRGQR
jgi:AraC-like DNA-binding protein